MDCKSTYRDRRPRAFTVAEMAIALGLSALILIGLASVYLYSSRTFVVLTNHIDLDNASRLAVDRISQEIRQADHLVSFATNQLTFQKDGTNVTFIYYPGTRLLMRQTAGKSEVLLKDCNIFRYEIFQRTPSNGVFGFFPVATAANCKVVRMTWLCSRQYGDQLESQTSLRSAQVVLRNQHL
jgi:hypothetical protein